MKHSTRQKTARQFAGCIPLKLHADQLQRIKDVAHKTGLTAAEVMRQSIKRGIDKLEKALAA